MTPKGTNRKAVKGKDAESSQSRSLVLGEMLRNAREDLGMDYGQLAELTKLRPSILESLENEEWDRLAAPVFIKGFLKSYARALRLPEQEILKLYGEEGPSLSFTPKPLASLTPSRKKTPVALFIFLIVLVGLAFFSWHRYDLFLGTKKPLTTGERSQIEMMPPVKDNIHHLLPILKQTEERPETRTVSKATGVKSNERAPDSSISNMLLGSTNKGKTAIPNGKASIDQAPIPVAKPNKKKEPSQGKKARESVSQTFTLEAQVRETTWVKIFVDHKDPKEYIFRPGSHPRWKARKGFEIIIGNAGGIALVFNGKKIDNLGQHGKVIRLKLPK